MSDIIHLLPDSIANQIAAGEVIQRPASVVKELLENSVDAGARNIRLDVQQAGRESIRVTDDGKGMSPNDARMAFERHATSKISSVEGLYTLTTMGFRGEALASIAAVAQVELLTRTVSEELGTSLSISGSTVLNVSATTSPVGTILTVKNLFFNVPARRKFLKTNETEFRHIMIEFERVALINPNITFALYHNNNLVLELPATSQKTRILNILGKKFDKELLPISMESPLADISGFVGRPEGAKKKGGAQYFFVNGRYMRHPYFHKAVMTAYEQLIPVGCIPNYIIFFNIDPSYIDVNIHPTKTEIKFSDERALFQLLISTIREALGSSVAMPSIDFERSHIIDMPIYPGRLEELPDKPKVSLNPDYNPFGKNEAASSVKNKSSYLKRKANMPDLDWAELMEQFKSDSKKEGKETSSLFPLTQANTVEKAKNVLSFVYKDRYIITALSTGLALVDYHRAHVRVLYEQFLSDSANGRIEQQQLLFPEVIEFEPKNIEIAEHVLEEMSGLGFEFSPLGNGSFSILAAPSLAVTDAADLVFDIVETNIALGKTGSEQLIDLIAGRLAEHIAMPYGSALSTEDADLLLAQLFAIREPNYTPGGKIIISIVDADDIDKRFD
ncbi:DNA mismatch repair protein MutL [Porphyromonas macacae]|uniref:DNA mismatch repair protein MutL n=1 Tax=Porphyromonas macacae TaxID=28115 RepID=A0A0A2EF08_9PORP|nr:DNA mismatch repair endonuclease MutL [Porphyromonas macacae]KGN75019.1 DNA mismatch repair protein MutL [Porphyromonas macacae]